VPSFILIGEPKNQRVYSFLAVDPFFVFDCDVESVYEIRGDSAEDQAFGTEKLSNTLIARRNLSGQALNKAILMQAECYADNGFKDDVLLMSITLK
jgi:hypothetical protein